MEDIEACAKIYIDAYSKEPWNENYDLERVKNYLAKFTSNDIYTGWVLIQEEQIVAFVLGIIMSYMERDYFRIEDICVRPDMQRKGIGKELLRKITLELKIKIWILLY